MTFSQADAASKHGAWTYEEDKLLAKYQEIHGNRWSLVAVNIPGRTGQQCAQRWRHKVNPDIRKEKWNPEEDRLLASLVAEHGNRWADIARHMPGRTDQQCMGRWRRHLDPNIRKCQWQVHEDLLLKQQYEALGPQWSNISKFLQGRTAQQCRARWFQLCPASAAPPVPRTARNQNGRRDRHHDGASIQESARQLVSQMGGTGGADNLEDGDLQPLDSAAMYGDTPEEEHTGGTMNRSHRFHRRSSQGMMGKSSACTPAPPLALDADDAFQTHASYAHASPVLDTNPDMIGGGQTPTKSRRAAAKRSDVFRQQLLSPEKAGAGSNGLAVTRATGSPVKAGRRLETSRGSQLHPSQLSWEGTRTRTRAAKPRRRFSPILRSRTPSAREFEEAECRTPRPDPNDNMKILEAEALEAAAALTEMAGGPRVHPSTSPPSVHAPDPPLLNAFRDPQSPGQLWISPQKDTSCCTPAKRPAAVPLWDGPSSSKLSRPGMLAATPQRTPSHMHMHTPMLHHLGGSPGFGASPLPVNQDTVVMTPGSRNMLRSMPLDPVDKMDLPGDFSPGLMSSQGTVPTRAGGGDVAPSPNVNSAKPSDLGCSSAAPDPRNMKHNLHGVITPAICGGSKHAAGNDGSPRALSGAAMPGPPTRRSLVFSEDPEENLEASGAAAALLHASALAHNTPAQARHDDHSMLQAPSTVMSCPQVTQKVEDKYHDHLCATDTQCGEDTPLFSEGGGVMHHPFRLPGNETPPASVRLPGTPDDGFRTMHGCIERRLSGGNAAKVLNGGRKLSPGVHALENHPGGSHASERHAVSGAENSSRDAQRMASTLQASPQLGVQTLSPAVHRPADRGPTIEYTVGAVGVSLSPPASNGAADRNGDSRRKLSSGARCGSEGMFLGAEHSSFQPVQTQGDSRVNADCSVHFNINLNVKAVSNNSSTGKSSGLSSIDGLDRTAPRQDSAAADDTGMKCGRKKGDGNHPGDMSGDNGQTEDDGSFSIRQKLHSLVDDVFAFVV